MIRPTTLYHATTESKARKYRETGRIIAPVRGFDSEHAALAWAVKTGRRVILAISVDAERVHLLPDHHNRYGNAWWTPDDVYVWSGHFHAERDA